MPLIFVSIPCARLLCALEAPARLHVPILKEISFASSLVSPEGEAGIGAFRGFRSDCRT